MINPFKYIINIFKIIPIIDIPSIHTKITNIIFSIKAFLKASILFILLVFILVKNVLIFSITKLRSVSFNTTRNNDPDIIPNIIINIIKVFTFLSGIIIASPLFNFLFILSPLNYINRY